MTTRAAIGFIGLGIMGHGMAANLLRAGFPLTIWNRTRSRMDELMAAGARAGESPADVARHSEIIITCVSDTPDVRAVILGDAGVIHGARAGSLIIDMSTISPQATREIAAALAEADLHMLDAPISGGSEGAVNGTLSIMVGGEAAQVERARPAFEVMGKTVTHVGEIGAGQTVKIVNQILVVGNMLAASEAMLMAQAGGLDLRKALQAVEAGAAGSWMLSNRAPQVFARDFRPASPSISSRKTCAWPSKRQSNSAFRSSPLASSTSYIRRCSCKALAAKATTPSSKRWRI